MRYGPVAAGAAGVALTVGAVRARLLEGDGGARVAAIALVGVALVAAGIALWLRRPGSGGILLVATGLTWLGWNLRDVASPEGFTAGWSMAGAYFALVICLVVAFPHDLPRGWFAWSVAALAVLAAVLGGPVAMAVWDPRTTGVTHSAQPNMLFVESHPAAFDALIRAAVDTALVATIAALALCAWRWHRGGSAARRAFAPVLIAFAALTAYLAVQFGIQWRTDIDTERGDVFWAGVVFLGAVAVGVVVGLARSRAQPVAVAELVTGLEGPVGAPAVQESLARALHDPSLRVLLPAGEDGWVDADGAPVPAPSANGAALTTLTRGDRVVGALVHDPSLTWRPELLRAAGATAALALDNARLSADLGAQLVEVQAARRRLLEAGDAERRRLERDLHDGAQQRLVGLGLVLRLARSRAAGDDAVAPLLDEAEDGLRHALDDLRRLARGIHPAALDEGGLAPALRALAARAPFPVTVDCPDRRLPAAVEIATWFVVSEALTNAAKHAEASSARVTLEIASGRARLVVADDGRGGADPAQGSGLAGLRERVAALEGTLTVADAPEGGTRLVAEFPCG
ncbi:MAG: sensor histidine kinase [Thermoleophilia bacterium]